MKIQNTTTNEKCVFWKLKKDNLLLNYYQLRRFLTLQGFGQFTTYKLRTGSKQLFRKDSGVLKHHDANTIKTWLREWVQSISQSDLDEGGSLALSNRTGFQQIEKYEILEVLQKMSPTNLNNLVLKDLPTYSTEGFNDTTKLKLFEDTKEECHIRFNNGVVSITKDEIKFVPYSQVKLEGAVWESSIINHTIEVNNHSGLFEKFCDLSMQRRIKESENDWIEEFDHNEESLSQLNAFKCSYGYLVHTFNRADLSKAILFIDAESDLGRKEGRNGKSLVMRSIERYKDTCIQDGQRFQNTNSNGRFQFANVTLDTKFILINDLKKDFRLDSLFNMITDDIEIEKKKENKFVIPQSRKPKLGLTTNYVLGLSDTSEKARLHIVEFGSYWNQCEKSGEKPSDKKHLGKLLFTNFNSNDWNDFYNYGFRCVQLFLKNGLVKPMTSEYETKQLRVVVEGTDGTGEVFDWMNNWIKTTRLENEYHLNKGISLELLYENFSEENQNAVEPLGKWTRKLFDEALFRLCDGKQEYEYNAHRSHKGRSKSQRRFQVKHDNLVKDHIVITTKFDNDWSKLYRKNDLDYFANLK